MTYPYHDLLQTKADQFAAAIYNQLTYDAYVDPQSHREYSVALKLGHVKGKATIYYSPKKKTYKLVNQGLDDAISETITAVWNQLSQTASTKQKQSEPLEPPITDYQAYVDGSYDNSKKTVGYGAVILHNDQEQVQLFGRVHEFTESRQIGGELEATRQVIQWCEANQIPAIDIYYDYKGIEMWATGRWKTEKPISQRYKQAMQTTDVKVYWHKVKSHTGVHWNEVADKLAKKGTRS